MSKASAPIRIGPFRVFEVGVSGDKWFVFDNITCNYSLKFDTQQAAIDFAVGRYKIQIESDTHNENWAVISAVTA